MFLPPQLSPCLLLLQLCQMLSNLANFCSSAFVFSQVAYMHVVYYVVDIGRFGDGKWLDSHLHHVHPCDATELSQSFGQKI